VIFPEGGRSDDGSLMPFKPGAARLALRTGAAIAPVVVHGAAKVWNRYMWIPRPRKVIVDYLAPVLPERFPGTADELTEIVRSRMEARLRARSRGGPA
jgi:1-acyl-sn-glycerol-3-phosphate acyltransferase